MTTETIQAEADLSAQAPGGDAARVAPTHYFHADLKVLHEEKARREEEVPEGGLAFEGYASTEDVDRQNEITHRSAFRKTLKDYLENPVLCYMHRWDHVIGRILSARIDDKGLVVRGFVSRTEPKIQALMREGTLRALSFGYRVKKRTQGEARAEELEDGTVQEPEPSHLLEVELLEISIVSIPANRRALFSVAKSLRHGTDVGEAWDKSGECGCAKALMDAYAVAEAPDTKTVERDDGARDGGKGAVPADDWPKAPEDTPWSWNAAAASEVLGDDPGPADWARFRSVHAWYDAENPEVRASYKLPHHKRIGDGIKTVWRGVAAAMAALLGARGGVDIPAGDKPRTRGHLARHYKQFDKPVPDMRLASGELVSGEDEGRVAKVLLSGEAFEPVFKAGELDPEPEPKPAEVAARGDGKRPAARTLSEREVEALTEARGMIARAAEMIGKVIEGAMPQETAADRQETGVLTQGAAPSGIDPYYAEIEEVARAAAKQDETIEKLTRAVLNVAEMIRGNGQPNHETGGGARRRWKR